MVFSCNDIIACFLQCREIGYEIHEEVLKVLHELHTAMKTHQNYNSEFRQAENKLQVRSRNQTQWSQNLKTNKKTSASGKVKKGSAKNQTQWSKK